MHESHLRNAGVSFSSGLWRHVPQESSHAHALVPSTPTDRCHCLSSTEKGAEALEGSGTQSGPYCEQAPDSEAQNLPWPQQTHLCCENQAATPP